MKKKVVRQILGIAMLGAILLTSETAAVYGAGEDRQMETTKTKSAASSAEDGEELIPLADYMKAFWMNRGESIDLSAYELTVEDLYVELNKIFLEYPEFWWATEHYNYTMDQATGYVDMYTQYYAGQLGRPLFREEELEGEWEIVKAKTKDCKTDLEKAIVVHEHLVETIDYSAELGKFAHVIDGAILEKKAVCEGYALAYKYYMNRLGIPCTKMSGEADVAGGWMPHAWVQVQINGKWYLVDPTWDDPTGNYDKVYHTYLMRSQYAFGGHRWDHDRYEPCTDTTYDEVPWGRGVSGMWGYQGGIYYVRTDIIDNQVLSGIWRCDAEDPSKEPELVLPINDRWTADGGNGYSEIAYYEGELYYNTPRAVWKWNFKKGDEPELVFELEDSIKDEIYNVEVANGKIYYETGYSSDGYKTKRDYVIDPDYKKSKHPLVVTDTTITVDLNSSKDVYLQSAAPGLVTYESQDPSICDLEPAYADESCILVPKKPGETVIKVSAAETDRYLPGSIDVKIIVKGDGEEPEEPEKPEILRGDVDGSGKVDIGDVRAALRHVCGKIELNETQIEAGDVAKGDGKVDLEDLRKILRFVCNKITEL